MKYQVYLIDVKSSTYIDYNVDKNDKDSKSKVGDHVILPKCKSIFVKDCTPNWSIEVPIIKKIKKTVSCTYAIIDLNSEKIFETFYEKELQQTKKTEFEIQKVIKKQADKLHVKWKSYLFNSWIDIVF